MAYVALSTVGTGSVLTSAGYNQLIANNVTGHPTLSTTARTALSLGAGDNGTMVFDTTLNQYYQWNGSSWVASFWPTVNGSALAITGTAGFTTSTAGTTSINGGTVTFTRMYADTRTAPTIGTVTGAGSITPTPVITGTDFRGTASFIAGASFTGTAVQITFNSAFTTTPAIHITPYTRPAGTVGLYVTPLGSTAFQIVTGNATTSGSAYSFSYMTFG